MISNKLEVQKVIVNTLNRIRKKFFPFLISRNSCIVISSEPLFCFAQFSYIELNTSVM
jgi:hypothetical protein